MAEYYYKDLNGKNEAWSGLALNVQKIGPRKFYFQTCKNERFRLLANDKVLLWGFIEKDHYGLNLLKSYCPLNQEESPVKNINSSTIEKASNLPEVERYKFWTRFFAEQLVQNDVSPLYPGLWYLTFYKKASNWIYSNVNPHWRFDDGQIYNVDKTLHKEQIEYVSWGLNGSWDLISFKAKPDENSGRVKWWRKKIKEGNLPPVLVWYVNLLDAYIILDGHSRLLASYLENQAPEIVTLYSIQEQEIERDKNVQNSIVKSLQNRSSRKPISTESMNQVLISTFYDLPIPVYITKTKAVFDYGEWEEEVSQKILEVASEEELKQFLDT